MVTRLERRVCPHAVSGQDVLAVRHHVYYRFIRKNELFRGDGCADCKRQYG